MEKKIGEYLVDLGEMLADLVGSVDEDRFEIEDVLEKQLGARPMPFPGMDSKPR